MKMLLEVSIGLFWLVQLGAAGTLTTPCLMSIIQIQRGGAYWTCSVDAIDYEGRANHQLEIVGLTEDETAGLVSGVTYMTAIGAPITGRTIDVTGIADKRFDTNAAEKNAALFPAKLIGMRKVLAVRVISWDGANPFSREELIDNVFTDAVSLAERFSSCSYGKLKMEPFEGVLNGVTIDDGLYEVRINKNTQFQKENVEGWVIDQLNSDLGSDFTSKIDHYMIFLPDNVGEFGAYAAYPGQLSVYDGFLASVASAFLVHEAGHNLSLDHSSEGADEYGDDTCRMGYVLNDDDFRVCFNPPKSWTLGWYDDKHVTLSNLNVGAVVEQRLVGVAEYQKAGAGQNLFVRFGGIYYVGFNRAIGINADQIEAVNQVTITSSTGGEQLSYRLAVLGNGGSYEVAGVRVEVVSINLASTPSVAVVRFTQTSPGPQGDEPEDDEPEDDEPENDEPENDEPEDDEPEDDEPEGDEPEGNGPEGDEPGSGDGPGGSGGGTNCFSGDNLVSVRDKGHVRLDAVEIGDYVLSSAFGQRGETSYSRVYGFPHLQRHLITEYLQFTFGKENLMQLEVSPKHLLFSKGRTIAAGQVKVGDTLDGEDGPVFLVTHIETVRRVGVYAPATESGEIIVSGVRASNYVNLLDTSALHQHVMSHAFLAPMRFWCRFDFAACERATYTNEQGYSHWVKYFVGIANLLNQYGGAAVQYLTTLILCAPICAFLTLIDKAAVLVVVSGGPGLVSAGLTTAAACWSEHNKKFRGGGGDSGRSSLAK